MHESVFVVLNTKSLAIHIFDRHVTIGMVGECVGSEVGESVGSDVVGD